VRGKKQPDMLRVSAMSNRTMRFVNVKLKVQLELQWRLTSLIDANTGQNWWYFVRSWWKSR